MQKHKMQRYKEWKLNENVLFSSINNFIKHVLYNISMLYLQNISYLSIHLICTKNSIYVCRKRFLCRLVKRTAAYTITVQCINDNNRRRHISSACMSIKIIRLQNTKYIKITLVYYYKNFIFTQILIKTLLSKLF